jgi:hypothetical protein
MSATDTRVTLARRLRACRLHNIVDQTGTDPGEVAIYALLDPRDIEAVRYVGQTRSPIARYSQHFNTARLWLPDELPWWVKKPELRPLYTWMRELYRDGGRLPVMFVVGWTSAELARSDERRFIRAYLDDGLALLNVEAERRAKAKRAKAPYPAPSSSILASPDSASINSEPLPGRSVQPGRNASSNRRAASSSRSQSQSDSPSTRAAK